MKPLFIFIGLILSFQTYADSCLSTASNSELLGEVQRRMSSGDHDIGSGSDAAMFMATCSNGFLSLKTIKTESGEIKNITSDYLGSSICEEFLTSFRGINNTQIRQAIIISTCANSFLTKTLINVKGEARSLSSDYVGPACKDQAIEQNKKLFSVSRGEKQLSHANSSSR